MHNLESRVRVSTTSYTLNIFIGSLSYYIELNQIIYVALAPTSSKAVHQLLVVQHLQNHYNKIQRVKCTAI